MKMINFVIVLVAISSMYSLSFAQSGITSSCTNALITLSPCLNYITGNSSLPAASCCTQLATVVKSSPECLCEVLNSGGGGSMAAGLNINQTQALDLPNVCNVKTPPLSSCGKASASSPSRSPAGTSPATTTPSSISTGGSKTTPTTTQGDSSEASMSKLPHFALITALLFVASHALTTFTAA